MRCRRFRFVWRTQPSSEATWLKAWFRPRYVGCPEDSCSYTLLLATYGKDLQHHAMNREL